MTRSPNVWSVGDTAEVNSWDGSAYVWKPVTIHGFRHSLVQFTYQDGKAGSRPHEQLRRITH